MLPNQHSYTNSRHVEPIEEGLDGGINLQSLPFSFPFENTLSYGSHDAIVTPFNLLESFGKAYVVIVQLGRPFTMIVRGNKVSSSGGGSGFSIASVGSGIGRRPVLSFTDTGILSGFGEDLGGTAIEAAGPEQTVLDLLSQRRTGESDNFLRHKFVLWKIKWDDRHTSND